MILLHSFLAAFFKVDFLSYVETLASKFNQENTVFYLVQTILTRPIEIKWL